MDKTSFEAGSKKNINQKVEHPDLNSPSKSVDDPRDKLTDVSSSSIPDGQKSESRNKNLEKNSADDHNAQRTKSQSNEEISKLTTKPGDLKILQENYELFKTIHKMVNVNDKIRLRIKLLLEKKDHLEKTLEKSLFECKIVRHKLPDPRAYCNFTVTKMYEHQMKTLHEDIKRIQKQYTEVTELLRLSLRKEEKLSKQVECLKESLHFYKSLSESHSNLPNMKADFSNVSAMNDEEIELGNNKFMKREIYESILEENILLRRQLQTANFQSGTLGAEIENLKMSLSRQIHTNCKLQSQYENLLEKVKTCSAKLEQLQILQDD